MKRECDGVGRRIPSQSAHCVESAHLGFHWVRTLVPSRAAWPFPCMPCRSRRDDFLAVLEQACQQRSVKLFVLPPRSPRLNDPVERTNRTYTEQFYEITHFSLPFAELKRELQAWERTYDIVRPDQALGYLTPLEFLIRSVPQRREFRCH